MRVEVRFEEKNAKERIIDTINALERGEAIHYELNYTDGVIVTREDMFIDIAQNEFELYNKTDLLMSINGWGIKRYKVISEDDFKFIVNIQTLEGE